MTDTDVIKGKYGKTYTSQQRVVAEPIFKWDKKGRVTGSNIIGLEPLLQLAYENKLDQKDYGKNCEVFQYLTHQAYVSLSETPGLKNYNTIVGTADDLCSFAGRNRPYEETNNMVIEKVEILLNLLKTEIDIDFFNNEKFIKDYQKNGQSVKGALKILKKYKNKYPGISTLFKSMLGY